MIYRIPPHVKDGFVSLIKLSSEEIDLLTQIISSAKIGQGVYKIAEENTGKIASLDNVDFKKVLFSLSSLVDIFIESKEDAELFSTDFSQSYREEFRAPNEEVDKLKTYLLKILPNFRSVKLTTKAKYLLNETPNRILESRIISDIRIVFDDKTETKSQHAIVVHNLRLRYQTDSSMESFFISMDLDELTKLKETVERAIKKDEDIRNINHELEFITLT